MPRCSDQYVYVGFYRRKIPRSMAYTITEKEIRFRHPDYNPDRAQKLISSSMSRHLSIRNISSKSMHAFLSNLAHRHTDRQTNKRMRANAFTSPFVGGNNWVRKVATKQITNNIFIVIIIDLFHQFLRLNILHTGMFGMLRQMFLMFPPIIAWSFEHFIAHPCYSIKWAKNSSLRLLKTAFFLSVASIVKLT